MSVLTGSATPRRFTCDSDNCPSLEVERCAALLSQHEDEIYKEQGAVDAVPNRPSREDRGFRQMHLGAC
jgi:hypothetical protein